MPTLNAPLRALVFGAALGAAALLGGSAPAAAHCQVPCGIYGDHARVDALLEDATTVDKAMAQIRELAGKADAQSLNQATRWVLTKEEHAQRIQDTIAAYFLAQRVKPADPKDGKAYAEYTRQLALHHAVIVAAMKAKQSTDAGAAAALRAAIEAIAPLYPAQ